MYDVDNHKKTSKQVLTCVVTVSQLVVLKLIEALTSTSAELNNNGVFMKKYISVIMALGLYGCSATQNHIEKKDSTGNFEIIDNSDDFKNISTNHRIQEYQDQPDTSIVIRNSSSTGVAGLKVTNNKWLFRSGFGKISLLGTHPLNRKAPSQFTIKVSNNELKYSVRPHDRGDSLVEFWVKNLLVHSEIISEKKWHNRRLKLPNNTSEVVLKHHATGWAFEYLYWDILE